MTEDELSRLDDLLCGLGTHSWRAIGRQIVGKLTDAEDCDVFVAEANAETDSGIANADDAALIVAAVNALPDLIAEVRRLRETLGVLQRLSDPQIDQIIADNAAQLYDED